MINRIWDITLSVSDLEDAVDFYENVLGLQKKYEYKDYAGFDCGGLEIGLKTWGEKEESRKGEPCINFLVDDIDRFYVELKEKGVGFDKPLRDVDWGGRIANFRDLDGNHLQITQIDWDKYHRAASEG